MMVSLLILTLTFLFSEGNVEAYIKARSLKELSVIDQRARNTQQIADSCEYELAQKDFPISCVQHIDLLMETPHLWVQTQTLIASINDLCMDKVLGLNQATTIQRLLEKAVWTPACRQALIERREDLKYIQSQPSWN
jgi:hypothetical protein